MALLSGLGLALVLIVLAEPAFGSSSPVEAQDSNGVHAAFDRLPAHPRLHVRGAEGLAVLRDPAQLSPARRNLRQRVIDGAVELLQTPTVKFRRTGRRLEHGRATAAIFVSAAAYGVTGDRRFAERAKREMLAVCDWEDWVPSHYLGVAQVMHALSFGYDWTHDALNEHERERIRRALIDRGYAGIEKCDWWRTTDSNWGQVCWQGVTAAAIVLAEHDRSRSEKFVAESVVGLRKTAGVYAPDGAYPEGPGYWRFGTWHYILALDQFEKAFGTSFGLYDQPGLSRTGEYENAMFGPSGLMFNYSDCGPRKRDFTLPLLALAGRSGCAGIAGFEHRKIADGCASLSPNEALWALLMTENAPSAATSSLAADLFFGGRNDVAALRSSQGADAFWLGVKGGSVDCNHSHMDVGSFVLDAKRMRWAYDLGSQKYHSIEKLGTIDLWNRARDSSRWSVFRLGPSAHNLVTVDGARQVVKARTRIVPVSMGAVTEVALDLTKVYGDAVGSARRTFVFDRPQAQVTVKDVLTGVRPGATVRWQIVTKAACAIGGRTVTLSYGGETITLSDRLRTAWKTIDLEKGPNSWDCGNKGFRALVSEVVAPSSGAVTFEMTFGNLARSETKQTKSTAETR